MIGAWGAGVDALTASGCPPGDVGVVTGDDGSEVFAGVLEPARPATASGTGSRPASADPSAWAKRDGGGSVPAVGSAQRTTSRVSAHGASSPTTG